MSLDVGSYGLAILEAKMSAHRSALSTVSRKAFQVTAASVPIENCLTSTR